MLDLDFFNYADELEFFTVEKCTHIICKRLLVLIQEDPTDTTDKVALFLRYYGTPLEKILIMNDSELLKLATTIFFFVVRMAENLQAYDVTGYDYKRPFIPPFEMKRLIMLGILADCADDP